MATLNRAIPSQFLSLPTKPTTDSKTHNKSPITFSLSSSHPFAQSRLSLNSTRRPNSAIKSVTQDPEVVKVKIIDSLNDPKVETKVLIKGEGEGEKVELSDGSEDFDKFVGRGINAAIVLGFGTVAITKLLTIDHDYWQGWTLYEILRYAPEHNWIAYEEALKSNPVLSKMAISGVVYSLGDWIAQCYEGKPLFEFDRNRLLRSGLVGFSLHGSLSHYYYQFCEILFPFKDWWVVPVKIAFDQTVWAAVWNSIYFVALGFLRLESPANISNELKRTFWPMLTAGWKLWPFAHLITYGVIPVDQRLLWVDCVELIWVTILSTYSNENSEAQSAQVSLEAESTSSSSSTPEE
ncbi:hypothetical protein LguiB_002401 [Lonicera macranthoides]